MSKQATRRRSCSKRWVASLVLFIVTALLLCSIHPFLAIHAPVDADVLVVEGWVPSYVVDQAAVEMRRGQYSKVFVSGLDAGDGASDAAQTAGRLVAAGIDASRIVAVPARKVGWNRTSHMARAVRDGMWACRLRPLGVNVVTLGPHARQSRLAYSRLLGPSVPVGVISVPKDDYNPAWWFLSVAGTKKTLKDLAGWLKEGLFGLRT